MSPLRLVVAWATPIMAVGVACGVVWQPLAAAARPLLLPMIVTTLALAVMRTDMRSLGVVLRRPATTVAQIAWLLLVSPFVMWAILLLVPVPEALRGPLILYAATAPITSMPAFALLFGLDAGFVLVGVTTAAMLSPLTVPTAATIVMGDQMTIGAGDLALRLALVIGSCYAIGMVLRRVFGAARIAGWRLQLDAFFVAAATILGIAVMDGIVAIAARDPAAMWLTVGVALGVSFLLFVIAVALFWPAGRATALGAGLNSGSRNISIVLAVLGAAASDELIMVVAAAQIPIFVLPLIQRPLIRRLMAPDAATAEANA